MSIFKFSYDRPDPGAYPDNLRPKGLSKLWKIFDRYFLKITASSGLAVLGALPFILFLWLAVTNRTLLYALLAGIVGGTIEGPQLTALSDTILRSLRNETGFWWLTYRRIWRRDWKNSLLPGMVFGTILALQLFIILLPDNFPLSLDRFIILLAGFLLTLGLMNFVFPQIALMDLHFRTLLRNSLFLLLGNLPRSLGAVSWQVFLWGLLLIFLPDSFFLFILFGFWVPVLPALFLIYPVLDREFKIEESLKNL